jgi:DNA-binding beta-propeller fold protein YncE
MKIVRSISKTAAETLAFILVGAIGHTAAQTTLSAPGWSPVGLAYDGVFLYVADETSLSSSRVIVKVDPVTGDIHDFFPAPVLQDPNTGFLIGGLPSDLVSDGAGRLFVSDVHGLVFEIDSESGALINHFGLPFRGGAIAFDGTNLYIGNFDGSEVLVTDRSGTVLKQFILNWIRPAGMVFDPSSGHLWTVDSFTREVKEVTADGVLVRTCIGPREPGIQGLGAVTMVGSKLYIAEVSDPNPFDFERVPGTIFIVDPASLPCNPPVVATVMIDIMPGGSQNSINPRSRGVLPVAILTTDSFDATSVAVATVRFGVTGTEAPAVHAAFEDVDGDGDADLILHFNVQSSGIACGANSAFVTGKTLSGGSIRGSDVVRTVGCK